MRLFAVRRKSPPALTAPSTSSGATVKNQNTAAAAPLALTPTHTFGSLEKSKKSDAVLVVVANAIRIVDSVADSLPFLSVATGLTLTIIETLLSVQQNRADCIDLVQRIGEVFLAIAEPFRNVDHNDIPSKTRESIDALQSRLEGFRRDVETIATASKWKRYLLPQQIKSDLAALNSKLDDCLRFLQLSCTLTIQCQTERLALSAQVVNAYAPWIPEVPRREIDLNNTERSQTTFEVYEASYGGKVVSLKCFKGITAKKNWARYLEFESRAIHPNVVTVIGKSSPLEPTPYIIYAGSESCPEKQLARSLRSDQVKVIVRSCVTFIYGLSAGLLYLHDQGIPLTKLGAENIRLSLGANLKTILSIDWPEGVNIDDLHSNVQALASDTGLLNIVDSLGTKVFQAANEFLPNDWRSGSTTPLIDESHFPVVFTSAPPPKQSSKHQDVQRGLIWKTKYIVPPSLRGVYDDARRLHNECWDSNWSSDRYLDIGPPSTKDLTREEFTFSARVQDYTIINRSVPSAEAIPAYYYRTILNNWSAQMGKRITYRSLQCGPQHHKTWSATVYIDNVPAGAGIDPLKGTAEDWAAHNALVAFRVI